MRTVWKYVLDVTDEQTLDVPVGAKFIHVEAQYGKPCLWAEVNPEAPAQERKLYTVGTGHDLPDVGLQHIGSYLLLKGEFVGHVYEDVPF